MLSMGRHRPCGTGFRRFAPPTAATREKGRTMENSLSTASSFYGEPPLSPTPAFAGEAHAPQHVPEFAPPRTLSPVVAVPRVDVPRVSRPEPGAAATGGAPSPSRPPI